MIYSLKQLQSSETNNCQAEINGKWVPARPISCYSFREKLKRAWLVFTGKVDVFAWPENQ